jgi:hypothetical protein
LGLKIREIKSMTIKGYVNEMIELFKKIHREFLNDKELLFLKELEGFLEREEDRGGKIPHFIKELYRRTEELDVLISERDGLAFQKSGFYNISVQARAWKKEIV